MSVSESKKSKDGGVYETVKIIVQALLLALIVRTFLFQPFNIPSGSMKETLLVGDYLFVSKFSYGYSRYSFPFGLAPFSGRIWPSDPQRGDVAVFKLPSDTSIDYIKRVIGLPGDKIQVRQGTVYINDVPVKRERISDYIEKTPFGGEVAVPRYRETLPNGVSFDTLDLTDNGAADNTRVYEVPEGHYFMMGDNRDNSVDSRFPQVGYVPFENFIGKAEIIFFSVRGGEPAWEIWNWPWSVRWGRIGTPLWS
ncbi:signal peptidase I [Roseibium sp. RKSG952]|uniref:signal peptidase I n=1 Tax=Roseibium sp. RKSG952 TaxID=2529384 RepID=UPI0012BBB89B|nr:signal peptidase I [Roseibium sp. RKSG952]MTH97740.1 signal peptidase I [Roseibium sp. RKSG952]